MKTKKLFLITVTALILFCGCGSTNSTTGPETETEPAADVQTESVTETAPEVISAEEELYLPETYDGTYTYNGTPLVTLNDIFALDKPENRMYSFNTYQYICVVDKEDIAIRAIANIPEDRYDAVYALDMAEDDYEKKLEEMVGDLKIARLDDLRAGIPTQEELDQLIGITESELCEKGFVMTGYMEEDLNTDYVPYIQGDYAYLVRFEEVLPDKEELYLGDASINTYTVKSVEYYCISDNTLTLSNE